MAIAPTDTYTQAKQEFLNSVLNKIGKQEFSSRSYTNPLKRLKGGFIDNASDIEEIYVGRVEDTGYDKEGAGVLDRVKPNVKVQYHTNTIEHGYKTTVHMKQMRKGFRTQNALQTMANAIITSLHTGAELDDYQDCIDTLKALASSPVGTKQNVFEVEPVTNETTSKALCKVIKKVIPKMKEMTSKYSDVPSYGNADELILFLDSDTDVEMNVEHLANAFNMSVTELNQTTKLLIPDLKAKLGNNIIALMCHHKCIKLNPSYYDLGSIANTRGKFVNYDLVTETLASYTTWYPYIIIKEKAAL